MPEPSTLVIIDGHYYAYRYFFGMPALTGPGQRPTGVTHAFALLFKTLREHPQVSHVALVLDHRDKNFRHDIYPDYKAHRDPMPDALRQQIPDVERLAAVSGVPLLCHAGFEGDDVIATLAQAGEQLGMDVRICSKDKDLSQVLSDRVHVWDPAKDELKGPVELLAEKDIRPDQVVDYLCMIGDSADNVPGIKGVGPKTAVKLLTQFGSLEALLANTDQLRGKQRENVEAFRDRVDLTRRLITFAEVPDLPSIDSLVKTTQLPEEARSFYEELGFSIARHFPIIHGQASEGADYHILSATDLPAFLDRLRAAGRCAVDTETTDLDPHRGRLVGISFAAGLDGPRSAAYLPLLAAPGETVVDWQEVQALVAAFMADPAIAKVFQNAKFDLQFLRAAGAPVAGLDGDPMLASWLLDPARDSHGLDQLTRTILGEEKIPTAAVIDLDQGQTMAEVPVAVVARYACEDAQCTWRLAQVLEAELAQHALDTVYREQEIPLAAVLADMEYRGIAIDPDVLDAKRHHLEAYLDQVDKDIRAIAGKDFNPASPKQIAAMLFTKLGLPVIRKTRSGPSTDVNVLKALRDHHPLPGLLLQHRSLAKLLSSYLRTLPEHINPVTGRIHTHLRQTGTETGRLSSDQPNLQNLPKRAELGRVLRAAFVPSPGHCFVAADYSQVELRVLAHLSQDPTLCAAFHQGADIHRFVAARVQGCDEQSVTPAMRQAAKAVNFGIIYGQSSFGLAQQLGITRAQAKDFIDEYFARFDRVKHFVETVVAQAKERGYVETLAGRRRHIRQLASSNHNERLQGERTALNSTIQGSAADLIKRAMLACAATLPDQAHLILQIHDELLVECPQEQLPAAISGLRQAMTGAWNLSVPLEADVRQGDNWLSLM